MKKTLTATTMNNDDYHLKIEDYLILIFLICIFFGILLPMIVVIITIGVTCFAGYVLAYLFFSIMEYFWRKIHTRLKAALKN